MPNHTDEIPREGGGTCRGRSLEMLVRAVSSKAKKRSVGPRKLSPKTSPPGAEALPRGKGAEPDISVRSGAMTRSVLKAVYDPDLEELMRRLGVLGAFKAGKLRCPFSRDTITWENLHAFYPEGGDVKAVCD